MATDTDEDFLIERMAKARLRYRRIMPLEASIFNLRLVVDKAPDPLIEAQGPNCQRAWAYMRDANGGNALSKLSRYETALLREYDRSRHELEKLQKICTAKPIPPPIRHKPAPGTRNPRPFEAPSPEPLL